MLAASDANQGVTPTLPRTTRKNPAGERLPCRPWLRQAALTLHKIGTSPCAKQRHQADE